MEPARAFGALKLNKGIIKFGGNIDWQELGSKEKHPGTRGGNAETHYKARVF